MCIALTSHLTDSDQGEAVKEPQFHFWQLCACTLAPVICNSQRMCYLQGSLYSQDGLNADVQGPAALVEANRSRNLVDGVVVVEAAARGYWTTLDWFYLVSSD